MFLFEHILLTTRFKWCDLNDVYCAIMLTMMIKNHTGVQQQNIQSIQSVQQRSIETMHYILS